MNGIRKLQFMFKGYRHFTKWEKPLPPLEGTLEGKTFVITGANSGIGLAAAKEAAKRKAHVYLVCRNQKRGEEAVNQIIKETQNQNVFLILGEMGEKKQMQKVYTSLAKKLKSIDILVHNAGCMLHNLEFNEDKIEKNFATNTFAIYYLTNLCLELLHPQSRVIAVSSGGCLTQPLQIEDIYMQNQKYDGTDQYARNKRQQLVIFEEFAKKYPLKGKFVTMHPGWVDTLAVRTSMPDFYEKMKDKLKTQEEGADTIMYLSLAPLNELQNGQFYFDREVADKHLTISCTSHKQSQVAEFMKKLQGLSKAQ